MAEVVQLITPKRERRIYEGQAYELVFDPKAPPSERWVWIVDFTQVYRYTGAGATIQAANTSARRRIRKLLRL